MATKKKEIDKEFAIAINEIGHIKPWFEKEVNSWVFEHNLYPVRYAGATVEEVIKNYPKYLKIFIEHRLKGNLDPINEKKTKGKGGARLGAGRPKGSSKQPTTQIRVPVDIAIWLKHPGMYEHIRQMIKAYPTCQ